MTDTHTRGRIRVERALKRVRAYVHGEVIADTTDAKLVWEKPYYPTYYVPTSDVRMDLLVATGHTQRSPSRGTATYFTLKAGDAEREHAAWTYADSPIDEIRDHVVLDWDAMDAWFEEDEEVFVHPRDPYTRIDILPSSRHIRVEIDGVAVAESDHSRILFETGLPARYYLPKTDVRMDLLTPTDHETSCPYKGTAEYWSVDTGSGVHENVAWGYATPLEESARVAGLVCFYNEKVDIYVDGQLEEKPKTVFT